MPRSIRRAAGQLRRGTSGQEPALSAMSSSVGMGTWSRRLKIANTQYALGVLVQANYGVRDTLRIAGVPVGKYLQEHRIYPPMRSEGDSGSIIIVIATDAPLLPHQLKRVARRAAMGLARNGSYAGNGSGDIFVAFSTANADAMANDAINSATFLGNGQLDSVFLATVEATEEAIINSMVAARDMRGQDGHFVMAIPHDQLRTLLKRYNRLNTP